MTLDSTPELARRVLHLENLVKRSKPADGLDNAALSKRLSTLESAVTKLRVPAPAKAQAYVSKPIATRRVTKLEREVERLKVKESPIMSNYLLTTGKAADSDKLDGLDSTAFGRPVFLTTPLTSTSWDGDSFSSTGKTLIDLSAVFGVPAGVKAVLAGVSVRDSGSAASTGGCYLILSPVNTNYVGVYTYCAGLTNDAFTHHNIIVPCDANGDIYYQTNASGSGTMDVYLEIWGYWL